MSAPKMPPKPEVITRTLFYTAGNDQWYWQTKSITNEVIATSEGGYPTLRETIGNYFAQQNVPYGMFEKWPSDYGPLQKLPENQFQINKFITQQGN